MQTHLIQNESSYYLSAAISSIDSEPIGLLVLATIGGILVFIGLIFEKLAEWMDERFLGEWSAHKKFGEVGWIILMIGIAIEIADAGFAANESWQTRQIAIKNAPANQLISDISATVQFRVNKTDFVELPRYGDLTRAADLWLIEPPTADVVAANGGRFNGDTMWDLMAGTDLPILSTEHSISYSEQKGEQKYFMQFRFDEVWAELGLQKMKKRVNELNRVNVLRISVKYLPHDLEIIDGSVKLVVNDSVLKTFQIPRQKNNRESDGVDIYSNTTPFIILAFLTNSASN